MRARLVIVVSLLLGLGGCGRIGYASLPRDGQRAPEDGGQPDGLDDAGLDDAGAGTLDSGVGGAGDAGGGGCFRGQDLDGETVFRFDFDDLPGADTVDPVGGHVGEMDPEDAAAPDTAGVPGCGGFLDTRDGAVHVHVPASPAFELPTGSLDFFLRVDAPPPSERGILSRDATGQSLPGHLTVFINDRGTLQVRLQNTTQSEERCFEGMPLGVWTHVGVHFGPPDLELYIDGTLRPDGRLRCRGAIATGIDGNANPWVFGAEMTNSTEGGDQHQSPFAGALDEVRLSRVRRDFSAYRR